MVFTTPMFARSCSGAIGARCTLCAMSTRWPIALALSLSACASGSQSNAVPNLFDTQQRIAAYIDSGRYAADCATVAERARAYLDRRARQVPKPAAVFDIDETSLSNWPAYRVNGWTRFTAGECDLEKGPCGLRAWQTMAKAKAIPTTLELVRHARSLGVAVFFISGRPPDLREATERNLHAEGYEWDGVVLLPEGATFKSALDFKAPARRRLTEQGYTILFSI